MRIVQRLPLSLEGIICGFFTGKTKALNKQKVKDEIFQWNKFPIETKIPFCYDEEKKLFFQGFNFNLLPYRFILLIGKIDY